MNKESLPVARFSTPALAIAVALLAGCGDTEDVRVTFCKGVSEALVPDAEAVEWTENENRFKRPEYAIVKLNFDVVGRDGGKRSMDTECFYAYDAVEETVVDHVDPFFAYATLPFAMAVDGRMISDAELVRLRNDEQVRRGKAVITTLETGARDMADRVRAQLGR